MSPSTIIDTSATGDRIAIVGMAGRFPGAASIDQLWARIRRGDSCLTSLTPEELRAAGVSDAALSSPDYVTRRGVLDDADAWDADFFGVSPRDAELTDPQLRVFLECAWTALEDAGFDPRGARQPVGIFASSGLNAYLHHLVRAGAPAVFGHTPLVIRNDKDYVASWVAYKLGLHGPAISVQTACSSSLVAVHLACQSLLEGECDLALAGGVTIRVPARSGYMYEAGGIDSADGCCRPFDAEANGTVSGDGAAVVVLARLEDAVTHGDRIWAVIAGTAVTNDGSAKAGFSAPGVRGQTMAIRRALAASGRTAEDIGYVEAHGTGTRLGDPLEVRALTRAFAATRRQYCALGSIKAQVGHLDAAAGVTGLIKTALIVHHGEIPPLVNFTRPNLEIDFAATPFYVPVQATPWPETTTGRVAGVSSFGIGGTNAHAIVEEAPTRRDRNRASLPAQLFVLSAATGNALDALTADVAAALRSGAIEDCSDAAFTLATGRARFPLGRIAVFRRRDEGARRLSDVAYLEPRTGTAATGLKVAFMFPGQQALASECGRELYAHVPVFREWIDRAAEVMADVASCDLRALVVESGDRSRAEQMLRQTEFLQPALFAFEFALAQTWRSWGIEPAALIGHSLGEYVAACLAGVFAYHDALRMIVERGRIMQPTTPGAMWAVLAPAEGLRSQLAAEWDVAAINGPAMCVIAAPANDESRVEAWGAAAGVQLVRLPAAHAFHSRAMDPILGELRASIAAIERRGPSIPIISNVTGTWMTMEQAVDPGYWATHARTTVRFDRGVSQLSSEADVLVEMGPGHALTSMARVNTESPVIAALDDRSGSLAAILEGLGAAWVRGAAVDWSRFYEGCGCRRVRVPSYAFQRTRYWYQGAADQPVRPWHRLVEHLDRSPGAQRMEPRMPQAVPAIDAIVARQVKLFERQLALLGATKAAARVTRR